MRSKKHQREDESDVDVVVEVGSGTKHHPLGSIEVVQDQTTNRVYCVPRSLVVQPRAPDDSVYCDEDRVDEHRDGDDFVITQDLFAKLAGSVLDSTLAQCAGGCAAVGRPSALRDPSAPYIVGSKRKLHVKFGNLEIHEFDMTLGDHPSAVTGPPVALAPNSVNHKSVHLDEYEANRTPRRKRKQLKLSYRDRQGILQEQNFSRDEVNTAWAEALRIRQQRRETLQRGMLLMMWDDFCESSNRKYRRTMAMVGI